MEVVRRFMVVSAFACRLFTPLQLLSELPPGTRSHYRSHQRSCFSCATTPRPAGSAIYQTAWHTEYPVRNDADYDTTRAHPGAVSHRCRSRPCMGDETVLSSVTIHCQIRTGTECAAGESFWKRGRWGIGRFAALHHLPVRCRPCYGQLVG